MQFIPSGGFEAIGDGKDFDSQWDNYSIPKSLFRELLEECFGMDEDVKSFRLIQNHRIVYVLTHISKRY